jgi:hypothetical protein
MLNFIILNVLVIVNAFVDGVRDNIDHHKGAKDLKHVFHLVKHLDRLLLILIGVYLMRSYTEIQWYVYLILLPTLCIGKLFWYLGYYKLIYSWINLDERIDLSFGWKYLDEFIGFDKEIEAPIFRWPWR